MEVGLGGPEYRAFPLVAAADVLHPSNHGATAVGEQVDEHGVDHFVDCGSDWRTGGAGQGAP